MVFSFLWQAEHGGASEKSPEATAVTAGAAEKSKEACELTSPPADPGECGSGEAPIAADGASSGKTEAASTQAQIIEGTRFFAAKFTWLCCSQ